MALALSYLGQNDSNYGKILQGYLDMMASLLKSQRKDGLYGEALMMWCVNVWLDGELPKQEVD